MIGDPKENMSIQKENLWVIKSAKEKKTVYIKYKNDTNFKKWLKT